MTSNIEVAGSRKSDPRTFTTARRAPFAVGTTASPRPDTLRHVRRANDSIRVVEVRADFCTPEGVVSESDRVCPGGEHLVREARRDPDPVGSVLPVHDAHVDLQVGAQRAGEPGARSGQDPDDVSDEEDAQGGDSRV